MAVAEDAASVLEIWVQDSANLPAEMQHLMEEIEAKDKIIAECRTSINHRDMSLQRHVKANGGGAPNPKEEQYNKTVLANFEKAQTLQEEKIALSEKSRVLLDRQIKRLDQQIRSLESSGILPPDPLLPSILHNSPGNRLPPLSSSTTGANTPLNPIPGNAGLPPNNIANAAIQRLLPTHSSTQRNSPPTTAASSNGAATPTSAGANASAPARGQRESSIDAKRRRTNLPTQSSSLRQSSLGPASTPKAGTPTGSVRGGSVGPRASGPAKKFNKTSSNLAPPGKGSKKTIAGRRKGRKGIAGIKASMSDTGEESALSEDPGSETEGRRGTPGAGNMVDIAMGGVEEEGEDDGDADGDDKKYCTCKAVSYGNMVACDNDDCPYEWFHWNCVGMTKEPVGKWYCAECTQKLGLAK